MYSLLVSPQASEQSKGKIVILGSRAFEYTAGPIALQFRSLSVEAQECIKSWPCMIMQEGRGEEKAYVSQITAVEPSGQDIKFSITPLSGDSIILNDSLWKMRDDLDIEQWEFNRNHWAIKDKDLFAVLSANGYRFDSSVTSQFTNEPLPAPPRSALIAARDRISAWGHTEIDDFLLEAGVFNLMAGREIGSRRDRANRIIQFAIENPAATTAENSLFSAFIIKKTSPTEGDQSSDAPIVEIAAPVISQLQEEAQAQYRSPNRVFIVHGQNETARATVVSFLTSLGLQAIVLHEQPNMGRHLLTKFIQEAELVTFAVVVMTDDDMGGVKGGQPRPRARQNVILELGYFLSHLGQPKVCALITPNLETPSDFDGIVFIRMDDDGKWKNELARELRAAKMPIIAQ